MIAASTRFTTGFIMCGHAPVRRQVYEAVTLHQVLQLQLQHPGALIGLPKTTHWENITKYNTHLRPALLCAHGHLRYPILSLDILCNTDVSKLLLGNLLLHFNEDRTRIVDSEEVTVIRPPPLE